MLKKSDIKFIVVHCTDSSRDFTTFEQVNFWHKQKGWMSERSKVSIGYHWFGDGLGRLTQGRRTYGNLVEKGAAQFGLNSESIGICFALKNGETPSNKQLSNLKTLLKKEMKNYNIPVEQKDSKGNIISGIIGHRDVAKIKHDSSLATECPTDIFYNLLQNIKKEIKEGK